MFRFDSCQPASQQNHQFQVYNRVISSVNSMPFVAIIVSRSMSESVCVCKIFNVYAVVSSSTLLLLLFFLTITNNTNRNKQIICPPFEMLHYQTRLPNSNSIRLGSLLHTLFHPPNSSVNRLPFSQCNTTQIMPLSSQRPAQCAMCQTSNLDTNLWSIDWVISLNVGQFFSTVCQNSRAAIVCAVVWWIKSVQRPHTHAPTINEWILNKSILLGKKSCNCSGQGMRTLIISD